MTGEGPLAGTKVLDICQLAVGPLAAAWLGQLGAEVIKVESPQGDPIRRLEPLLGGVATYYSAVNVNKKSIVLDLKNSEDLEVLMRLARDADIFMQNFRPGVVDRLGIGYEALSAINPGLVYMSCSGYGSRGPRRTEGGADNFIRMFTGFDTFNGRESGAWERFRNLGHVDHVTSSYILEAVLAALLVKRTSGIGQLVETSMLQATMAYQMTSIVEFLATGEEPRPLGSAGRWGFPDQAFQTKDGYIAISASNDEQWRGLCDCLSLDKSEGFRDYDGAMRIRNRERLLVAIEFQLKKRTTGQWIDALSAKRVPSGPFLTHSELCSHPQIRENKMIHTVDHPWGEVQVAGSPWSFSSTYAAPTRAPAQDEHGAEIRECLFRSSSLKTNNETNSVQPKASSPTLKSVIPLNGIRVVEVFSRGLAVPYAGMQLRDLGAKVVKIELPEGDALRDLGPTSLRAEDVGAVFSELNRGKELLTVDPGSPADVQHLVDLIHGADVLISDMTLAEFRELGFSVEEHENTRLVECRVSSFGKEGPWAGRPSSELIAQAVCGVWQYLGKLGCPPLRLGVDAAGIAAGLAAVQGILAAVIHRLHTGCGELVQVSEIGMMIALGSHLIAARSNQDLTGGWHIPAPTLPPEYPLQSADNPVEVSLPDTFAYSEFYRALGVPERLCDDSRFLEKLALVMHWEEYLEEIGPYVRNRTSKSIKEFVEAFDGMAVIGHTYGSLVADPQVAAMNILERDSDSQSTIGLRAPWDFGVSNLSIAPPPSMRRKIHSNVWTAAESERDLVENS